MGHWLSNPSPRRRLLLGAVRRLINRLGSARYRVEGDSMLPTLAAKEQVLAVPVAPSPNRLRRGDIVVLRHPTFADGVYLKRIVGLPNEEVRLDGGRLYVNASPLEEGYLKARPGQEQGFDGEWWVGPDEYFVLGDNRGDSQDSRAFGPINQRLILGRVWFRCWPPGVWGPLPGRSGRRGQRPTGPSAG